MNGNGGGVGPVKGGAAVDWVGTMDGPMTAFRKEAGGFAKEFAGGFADGAAFSTAVMGAGLNAIKQGAQGQVKSQFG